MPRKIESDLRSVGQLLKTDYRYRVPLHQRSFSWTIDEVEQLWDDILEAMRDSKSEYFLGTAVVQENKEQKSRIIIDGQQRLACLTMLFSTIRTVYAQYGDDRANEVYNDFLGVRDRRTRLTEPRLTLNEINEPQFLDLVVTDVSDAKLKEASQDKNANKSNVLIAQAMRYLRDVVRAKCAAEKDPSTFLLELEDFIRDRIVLILMAVDDEADAYLIFETLNDRGLELSITDLLKNYLFGRAGSRLTTVRRQWDEMVLLLAAHNETQFLRHYWLSKYEVVRERELYKEIKKKFSSADSVMKFMTDLRDSADKYAAITNVDNPIWTGYGQAARRDLETLQLFGLSQFRPLLLAALDVLPQLEVEKLIRVIVVLSMRYSIIGSLGPGNIEKAYSDAAIHIREHKINKAAKIFAELKAIYPDNARFRADFELKEITKPKLARYILSEITNNLADGEIFEITEDERKSTLEHIMPKSKTQHWVTAARDDDAYREYVNRIGNLTLLERAHNKAAANSAFTEKKKKAFSKSRVPLTSDLCKFAQWTTTEIEQRQRELATAALKVWSLPY
jgi:hypothetical protein